jgi:hypothetical protein
VRISVVDPVSTAIDHTKLVLFSPFDLEKWLVLGFSAWLAFLGETGSRTNLNWNLPGRRNHQAPMEMVDSVRYWIEDHLELFLFIVAVVIPLFLFVTVVLYWLSSRMKFVFVDGVVRNQAAVVEPWKRYAAVGNSLFRFRVLVGLCALALFGVLIWMTAISVWPSLRDQSLGFAAIFVLVLALFVWMVLIFFLLMLQLVVNDFVVPVMYVRGCRVGPALSESVSLIGANLGNFVLYVLLRIILAVAIGLIAFILVCCTCCVAALPYIGTVIMLPLYVFVRAYALHFFSQFDPAFAGVGPTLVAGPLIPPPSPGPPAPPASSSGPPIVPPPTS